MLYFIAIFFPRILQVSIIQTVICFEFIYFLKNVVKYKSIIIQFWIKVIVIILFQFPKCYHNLKENDRAGLDSLVCKLRKQIVCEQSNVMVRSMLLEIFERILTDFQPLSDPAKNLYESYSKHPVKICE